MNSELSHPVSVHFSSKKLVNISHQPKTDNESNYHLIQQIFTVDPEEKVSQILGTPSFCLLWRTSKDKFLVTNATKAVNSNGSLEKQKEIAFVQEPFLKSRSIGHQVVGCPEFP